MAMTQEEADKLLNTQAEILNNMRNLRQLQKDITDEIDAGNTSRAQEMKDLKEQIELKKAGIDFVQTEIDLIDERVANQQNMSQQELSSLQTRRSELIGVKNTLNQIDKNNRSILNFTKKITKALNEQTKEWDNIIRQEKLSAQILEDTYKRNTQQQELYYKSGRKQAELNMATIVKDAGKAANVFAKLSKDIVSTFVTAPEMLLMHAGIIGDAGLTLKATFDNLKNVPKQMDESFRAVVKATGLFREGMKDTFVDIIDPAQAAKFTANLPEQPLVDVGIGAKESAAALKGLIGTASLFRPQFMEANRGVTAFVANTVAGLSKMGVAVETSGANIDFFTRAFKQTPVIAAQSTKQLVTMADTLGINVGQAMKDFNANMKTLAQFGDRAIKVFADLEAQSVATGIKVGELATMAGKLDTFKGAAEAGQRLNAVLGGTFMDITKLVHADPAEKFEMIKEAVSRAGLSFETMNRRMRMVVAQAAGVGTVENLARLMGSQDAFDTAKKNMSTTAMSQKDLGDRITDTMTRSEVLNKAMGRLGGGFQKFVDRTRTTALRGSNIMVKAFSRILKQTKDSERAMIAFMTNFKGISMAADKIARAKAGLKLGAVAIASAPAIAKAAGVKLPKLPKLGQPTPRAPGSPGGPPPGGVVPPTQTTGVTTPPVKIDPNVKKLSQAASEFKTAATTFATAQAKEREIKFKVENMTTAQAKRLQDALDNAMAT
jgi:hypothetical protein